MMMKVTATTSSVAAAEPNSWPQKFLHFTNRDNNLLLLSLLSLRAYWYPSMRKWRIMIYLLLSVVCVLCCVWACSSTRCNHNLCRDACERFIFIYVMWILFFFVPFYDIIFCCVWDIKKCLYFFFFGLHSMASAPSIPTFVVYIYFQCHWIVEWTISGYSSDAAWTAWGRLYQLPQCFTAHVPCCSTNVPMVPLHSPAGIKSDCGKTTRRVSFFFCIIVPLKLNGNFRLPHVMTDNNCCECTMYVDYVVMCAVYVR